MIDYASIPSPAYVLEEAKLRQNLEKIKTVRDKAGIRIILALKGFAMWSSFPMVRQYLDGATASSLYEAQLCYEEMKSKAHTYAPAYIPEDFEAIMKNSSHITFNSLNQYQLYKNAVDNHDSNISCGLRVNPEYSEVETALYNPCALGSRLGETADNIGKALPEGIEGLHFHALCESNSYQLEKTLAAFEVKFGHLLSSIKWVNMGGGHLITHKDYDSEHLIGMLIKFREKHDVEIILEPGSAIAWQCGVLISRVLDIVENHNVKTALLDVSFTAHMPDTLEMPYRPNIIAAFDPIEGKPTYRLGGTSCLAGDYLSGYSFNNELSVGDMIIFEDMIHYTMVKTTMFNGVKHPNIGIWRETNHYENIRTFGYRDFKAKLS